MPICTVHLLALHVPIPTFLSTLSALPLTPLTISKVIRWIILPATLSTNALLARNIHWDLLLILPSTAPLPTILARQIASQWSIQAGVPSRLLQDFHAHNQRLLHPLPGTVPPLTGAFEKLPSSAAAGAGVQIASSSQHLEISAPLHEWIHEFGSPAQHGAGAVSMLNLLAFKPGMKSEYLKYGAEFARSVGSGRGGVAKIVGTVVPRGGSGSSSSSSGSGAGKAEEGDEAWDEIALAHYPSIWHFADMLASEDYQAVNKRHRVGSLRDTFILCTSELAVEDYVGEGKGGGSGAKL